MPDLEAIGDAATGGVIARTVEPRAGEDGAGTHEGACLNCGCALEGSFCHCCGQRANIHRTLRAFWHDVAHSVLHLEGKVWRTLPKLALRPGELTRRYVRGERAKFVSPMGLFLFSVFAMLAVFTSIGGPFDLGFDENTIQNTRAQMISALEQERRELVRLGNERADAVSDGDAEEVQTRDRQIAEAQETIMGLEAVVRAGGGSDFQVVGGTTGWKRLDDGFKKLNQNPGLAIYKIQNNAYKFSWLLIPLSLPFLWLLFPFRRGVTMYDHAVFVTYSLAFMTLFLVSLAILRVIGVSSGLIGTLLAFVPPIHMYLQLKGAYELRWWSAGIRTVLLLSFAFAALGLFLAVLLLLGALG